MRSGWTRTPDIVNCASEASTRRGEAHRRPPLCGGGVGWRGLPLRTDSRRGQRLPTDKRHSPAPRVSAGLRFAVILLSKAPDVGRDHLIHRKRSPFPYEWKDLTPPKLGLTLHVGRATSRFRMFLVSAQTLREGERVCRSPHPPLTRSPFPSRGRP